MSLITKCPLKLSTYHYLLQEQNKSSNNSNNSNIDPDILTNFNSNSTMLSLVIMGEYNDFKQLARDGVKNLHDAEGLPDEALLAINHPRRRRRTRQNQTQEQQHHRDLQSHRHHPHHDHQHEEQDTSISTSTRNEKFEEQQAFKQHPLVPSITMSSESDSSSNGGNNGNGDKHSHELKLPFHSLNLSRRHNGVDDNGNSSRSASSNNCSGSSLTCHHVPKLKSHPRDRSLAKV